MKKKVIQFTHECDTIQGWGSISIEIGLLEKV